MQQLFEQTDAHLMHDDRPSVFIEGESAGQDFQKYPFRLLCDLKGTKQSPLHHPEGSVWNHTMMVVDEAAQRRNLSSDARAFMWAALLHDIGKPATTKIYKGKITSYDHDKAGARLARDFLALFITDDPFIDRVCSLIYFHMHILYVVKDLPYGDKKSMTAQGDLQEIALLGLCDRLGRQGYDRTAEEKNIELFLKKVVQCKQ